MRKKITCQLKSAFHGRLAAMMRLFLFALLLIPLQAWAEYNNLPESPYSLWVGGVAVTNDNASNIVGEYISGTVSYDTENNVLTLDGATVSGATYTKGCIISGRSSLTISISGENTIVSTDTCTAILSITGGQQALTIESVGEGSSLAFNTERCIRNFNSLSLTKLFWNGEYTYQYDTSSGGGSGYRLMSDYGIEASKTEDPETSEVKLPTLEHFDLLVGGVNVTSENADNIFGDDFASATYNTKSNTLTLYGYQTGGRYDSFVKVAKGFEELNIHLVGYNEIGMYATYLFSAESPCTIHLTTDAAIPGKLKYNGSNVTDDNVTLDYGESGLSLTTEEYENVIEVTAGKKLISYFGTGQFHDAEEGASGDEDYPCYDYSEMMWYYTNAMVTNGNTYLPPTVTSTSEDEGYMSRMKASSWKTIKTLTFQYVPVEMESSVQIALTSHDLETTYATGTLTQANGSVALTPNAPVTLDDVCLTFTSEQPFSFVPMATKMVTANYDINVGGVDVTEFNAEDVMGDGTVSYDVETNTLTLNNASIAPEDGRESPAISYTGEGDLTFMLIGISTIEGGMGCECIRFDGEGTAPAFIFTTNEKEPGQLMGTGQMFDDYADVQYEDSLALTATADGQMIGKFVSYDLWVMGAPVTSVNKENILGDSNASMRFNPHTNTLSLYGADISVDDTEEGSEMPVVFSALPNLTVELHGVSHMTFSYGFVSGYEGETSASLTFTTDADAPGQLSWEVYSAAEASAFAEGFSVSCTAPLRSFDVCEVEQLISAMPEETYALMIGTTPVTSSNCTNILKDGGSVRYVEESHSLVLDNAELTNMQVTSSLEGGLKIYILGSNTISAEDNLIVSTVNDAPLEFYTSDTEPGNLTLTKSKDTGTWISGFAAPTIPTDYATATDGNNMTIARPLPISPILKETKNGKQPKANNPTEDFGWETWYNDPNTYLSVTINNVLYTLKPSDYNEGNWGDPNDPSGVNLTEVPADMNAVAGKMPGSDDFLNAFKGITFEVPEGTGFITVTGEIGANAKLGVKIGDDDPVYFPNEQYPDINKVQTITVPYTCTKNTLVYIYLAGVTPSTARIGGPLRGRVLTGNIKITSVGGSSSLIVNNNVYSSATNSMSNRVIAYQLPTNSKSSDNRGIVLSTVKGSSANARGHFKTQENEEKKITELGTSLFDDVDKDKILYIDLSGTDVKDMTVNRSAGLFSGFHKNTLFYLPADNDDGGEDNVILGGNCASLRLADNMDFRAPKDFTATNAVLNRAFSTGKTSTVFLPFAMTKAQADALGQFHTFKEIKGANAIFNDAETNGTLANTPYIFLPTATNDRIAVSNVSITGLDASLSLAGNMVGSYEKIEWATDQTDIYGFAAAAEGDIAAGQFVRVGAGAWMPPFRAFMQVASAPARLNVVIAGEATGIADAKRSPANGQWSMVNGQWTTLNGLRLNGKPAQKGLYINNGKKINVR